MMVFTETDGSSQMPQYRGEHSEVGEKVREGAKGMADHSTLSPMFGIEVICECDLLPMQDREG